MVLFHTMSATRKLITLFFVSSLTLGAGGTKTESFGNSKYLPKSDGIITWSAYGSPLTEGSRDILQLATASLDAETPSFRLVHDLHPELSEHHVFFSFVGGDPDPRCLDDISGGCVLAQNQCLVWEKVGAYRLCSQNRIRVFTANIAVKAPLEDRLHNIIRHEWVHVLGYEDGVGGPTSNGANNFTSCQLAELREYSVDAVLDGWQIVSPTECQ